MGCENMKRHAEDSTSDSEQEIRKKKKEKKKKKKSKKIKEKKEKKERKSKKHKKQRRREETGEEEENAREDQKAWTDFDTTQLPAPQLLASGLRGKVTKTILLKGSGPLPATGKILTLRCRAWYIRRGKSKRVEFWDTQESSPSTGYIYQVGLGKQIEGWVLGVPTMKVGEEAVLFMSAGYGYGMEGLKAWNVPGNADLMYQIRLVSIH